MKVRFFRPFIIALIAFLLGGIIDYGTDIETKLGLTTLFQIRGVRPPPTDVVLVAMDAKSDDTLSGGDFTRWRSKHAGLLERLQEQGAALIVFDLYFNDSQPEIDHTLAKAMKSVGNVLATDCVQTAMNSWTECGNQPGPVEQTDDSIDRTVSVIKINPPTPELASALLDHGPFFLSNDPNNTTIRQGWTFVDEYAEKPLLPVLAWLYYLERKGGLPKGIQPTKPFSVWLPKQRRQCRSTETSTSANNQALTGLERRIHDVICQDNSRYFDFYGPPKTITTVSYSDVLSGAVQNLSGKVVFVGQTSRRQADSFLTPFTNTQSGRMVGVEIMATHFANLLEGRMVSSPFPPALLMSLFGLFTGLTLIVFPGVYGLLISAILGTGYLALAAWLFKRSGIWLPIAIPLLIQLPLSWFISMYWARLDQVKVELQLKAKIESITAENNRLINQFFNRLQNEGAGSCSVSGEGRTEQVSGVCLATDIDGFTQIAQKTPPNILFDLLREYFYLLGTAVSEHGGKIANIAGDGMIAIWADASVANQPRAACEATLQMRQAIDRFNQSSGAVQFITRFGLHAGEFALGKRVGDKLDENPIGDAINTASRIETANKFLGTRILASSSITQDLSNVIYRPLGSFLLSGKNRPVDLMEIAGMHSEIDKTKLKLYAQFAKGLGAVRQGRWEAAVASFNLLQAKFGTDGPSNYYLAKLAGKVKPLDDWPGYFDLDKK